MSAKLLLKNNGQINQWAGTPLKSRFPPLVWLHSLVRIIIITLRESKKHRLSIRSGALTYTILLSMVPILAMSTAVVKGLGGGDQLREVVYSYIDTIEQSSDNVISKDDQEIFDLPAAATEDTENAGLTDHLRSAADQLFDYVDRTNFATLGTFGMLGIFLTVILVLNHVEAAMNAIWRVKAGRSILRKITDYLTLMVLLPIALNVALAAGAILKSQALALHLDKIIPADWLQSLLLNGVPILFLTFALYAVYLFFPNTKLKMIPTFIGALLAGTLWFITQNLYISMQIGVAKYNAIYGSFATLPLFLVWIYCGWLFVLLGAQIAYAIQNKNHYRISDQREAPALELSAAFDICTAISKGFKTQEGVTFEQIAEQFTTYKKELLETARDILISANLVHHSEETGLLMPSRPPELISPHHIIKAVFGDAPVDSKGGKASSTAVAGAASVFTIDQDKSSPGKENFPIPSEKTTETSNNEKESNQ